MPKKGKKSTGPRPNNSRKLSNARQGMTARSPRTKLWSVVAEHMPAYNIALTRDNVPYRVSQLVDNQTILTSSAGVDVFYATAFQLSNVDQNAAWTAVFDQYMIEALEIWLIPTYQSVTGGASNSVIYSVIDYDDSSTPVSVTALRQIQNCVETTSYEGTYRRWIPHIAMSTQNSTGSSTASGSVNRPSTWIDSASPSVNHYSFKCAMKASSVTTTLRLVVRYHLAFRNVF